MIDMPYLDQLERMIDLKTLHGVLADMADICREKADHVRETWQDAHLARQLDRAARVLDQASSRIRRLLP